MEKIFAFISLLLMLNFYSKAQSLAVNTDGSAADVSALLDIKSTSKGLLIPRMTLAQKNTVSLPATGLLVYQTDGTKGLYVNNGTPAVPNWQLVTASSNAWGLTGNSGTIDGTNFIGTIDNIPFTIKVNNQKAGRIDHLLGNSFFGYQSGNNTSTGGGNTANGFNSLYYNVAGSNATAVGYQAMQNANNSATPFTNYNMAIGYEALKGSASPAANTGNYNTALGYQTLWNNTTGYRNTATGFLSLYSNSSGYENVVNGDSAMYSNTTGIWNVAIGHAVLSSNTSADFNTGIGFKALYNTSIGSENCAVGALALMGNTTGWFNTAIGVASLYGNTTGGYNTAMGWESLDSNTIGQYNTAIGFTALLMNKKGNNNVAIGAGALYYNGTNNDYATNNTAIGMNALALNISGSNATAVGSGAMQYANSSTTPIDNYNVAVGFEALRGNGGPSNTGVENTAIGSQSLLANSSGSYNSASGTGALYSNTTGSLNAAMGWQALLRNISGNGNCANGYNSLQYNTSGSGNTAIGYNAGTSTGALNNTVALGNSAFVTASNTIQLGNNFITDVYSGVGNTATLHSGYAVIEKDLTIDNQNVNNGTTTSGLHFGASSGEVIASKRTVGGNQWGLDFYTNSSNRMCISYGGNVGIGETTPTVPLNFASTLGDKISLWGNGVNHYGFGIQGSLMQLYTMDASNDIAFGYGNSAGFNENMRLTGSGDESLKGSLTVQNGMGIIRNISSTQLKKQSKAVAVNVTLAAGATLTFPVTWSQPFSAGTVEAYVGNIISGGGWAEMIVSVTNVTTTGATIYVNNPQSGTMTPNFIVNVIAMGPQ